MHGRERVWWGIHDRRGLVWHGACVAGEVCVARGHMWQGGMHGRGDVWQGGLRAGETTTEAGGTHPTRMHSCLF